MPDARWPRHREGPWFAEAAIRPKGYKALCSVGRVLPQKRAYLVYGQLTQQIATKQAGPAFIEHATTLGAQKTPWVEHIQLFVIFDTYHAFSISRV